MRIELTILYPVEYLELEYPLINYSFQNEALDNIIDWLIILAPDNNIEDKGCENINGTEVETENEDFVSGSNIYIYIYIYIYTY